MAEAPPRVPGVEARAGKFPGPSLIPALNAIQERVGWLPREELVALSRDVRLPLYEIEGLVSFYPHFRTDPPVKAELRVCHDLSCWLRGADERIAAIKERYAADPDVEVVEGSCLGRCDIAPACTVNEAPVPLEVVLEPAWTTLHRRRQNPPSFGRTTPTAPPRTGMPCSATCWPVAWTPRALSPRSRTPGCAVWVAPPSPQAANGNWSRRSKPRRSTRSATPTSPSRARSRTGRSSPPSRTWYWRACCSACWRSAPRKAGCSSATSTARKSRSSAARSSISRQTGLVGPDAGGSGRRLSVEVFTSPGGYILGEESALIECMEGHRGEPRNKPPFPGTYGLYGMPTLMNSVETLAHVPVIAARGAPWWNAHGRGDHAGLKFFAVSGHVERPGVYCVPMGTTARELLDLAGGVAGGRRLGAIQPGGASSNFIGPDQLDVELDFGTLQQAGSMLGSGAIVVMAEGTDLLAAAVNVLRFFRDESCGKCVPCRVGSAKAHVILDGLLGAGGGPAEVDGDVRDLAEVMRRTSICGLGQVALGPVMSVLRLAEDHG